MKAEEARMIMPRLIPITKAVGESGCSYKLLKQLCDNNQIPHIMSGKRILINMDRLCEYLNTAGVERR